MDQSDEAAHFNSLTTLRKRGHFFVPIEIEELRHHVDEAEIDEGRLLVGHGLLQIKAYYLLARLSECLTIADDVHWLLRSKRLINDIIREQWTGGKDLQEAKIKSTWLFDLVDLRAWTSDTAGTIQNGGAEGIWVANVVGLLAMPETASRQERQAYFS